MCHRLEPGQPLELTVKVTDAGERLDKLVERTLDTRFTRNRVARAVRSGRITVSGRACKPGYRVRTGEVISITIPPAEDEQAAPLAEAGIRLDILHEDDRILVINKPPGQVVHPAPGHVGDTLVNGLLAHCPGIRDVGDDPSRPGIVHRLDRDTSGVMVVAKTVSAYRFLKQLFFYRRVEKQYLAMLTGVISGDQGRITLPIGRHPVKRKMMAVDTHHGRRAETRWEKLGECRDATLVRVWLKTGRTHQIRVHFKALGHPLVGDPCYGIQWKKKTRTPAAILSRKAGRQMLHARYLSFRHPWSGQQKAFTAPVPGDMKAILASRNLSYP